MDTTFAPARRSTAKTVNGIVHYTGKDGASYRARVMIREGRTCFAISKTMADGHGRRVAIVGHHFFDEVIFGIESPMFPPAGFAAA